MINNNELLKNAFLDASMIEMRTILVGTEDVEHTFSKEFEDKMCALAKSTKNRPVHISKKKLIIIIVAAAILVSLIFTIVVFGEKISSFIMNITDRSFDFVTESDDGYPETVETKYYPEYIPEGYRTVGGHDFGVDIEYRLSNSKSYIIFSQKIIGEGTISISNEGEGYKTYNVDDKLIYCFDIDRSNTCIMVWEYNKYMFYLNFPQDIGIEEGLKIIESMQKR